MTTAPCRSRTIHPQTYPNQGRNRSNPCHKTALKQQKKNLEQDIPRKSESSQDITEAEVNPALDPRGAALSDIARRRREERGQESSDLPPDEINAEAEEISDEGDNQAPQQEPSAPESTDDIYERDGKRYMKLKVDGEEQEMDLDKIRATAQKNLAADKRLAQAAERERQLQQVEQNLRQQAVALQQHMAQARSSQGDNSKPPTSGASDDVAQLAAKAKEAIFSGDEDSLQEALVGLASAGRQQPTQSAVTPEDIDRRARQAAQQAMAESTRMQTLSTAASRFKDEYSDIANDPQLWRMADEYTAEIAEANPELEPYQVMKQAGEQVRAWRDGIVGQTSTGLSDRTQRKRNSMGAVPGANRAATLGKDDPPPKTRRDVIGDMKRQRGQNF